MTGTEDHESERPSVVEVRAERDAYVADQMAIHHHAVARPVVPKQLPMPVRIFAGRANALKKLATLLAETTTARGTVLITAMDGTAGVGKTAIAVHWAHQVARLFPDGQLYVNLRGFDPSGSPMRPADAIRGFLDAFQVPSERIPAGVDAQASLYRSLVADKRLLVILDNARDYDQVQSLLPGGPDCLTLVTSRNQLASLVATHGAHTMTLDLLTEDDSRELLSLHLGSDRISAEPSAVDEIVVACARLPLALSIVAARAAVYPKPSLAALSRELRDVQDRLNALDVGDLAVRTVFSWSFGHLEGQAAHLFGLIGLHAGPDITTPAAASMAGIDPGHAQALVDELTRMHMLEERVPGRFEFHDLLRAYAVEQASSDSEAERAAAIERMLSHYLATAYMADRTLDPHRHPIAVPSAGPSVTPEEVADRAEALGWFDSERRVILAAIERAANLGFDSYAWQLAWTVVEFLDRKGHWRDLAETQRTALDAARRLDDRPGQIRSLRGLAGAYMKLGRLDDAMAEYRAALNLQIADNDIVGQANTHLNLSLVFELRERIADGLHQAEQSLRLFRAADNQDGQARALNSVGWFHTLLGDPAQAVERCREALALHQALGDRYGEAATWDSLGFAYHQLGDHLQAVPCFENSLRLCREAANRHGEATVLTHIGDAYVAAGNIDGARDVWRQALIVFDELSAPRRNFVGGYAVVGEGSWAARRLSRASRSVLV